jgi:hypothetical protein
MADASDRVYELRIEALIYLAAQRENKRVQRVLFNILFIIPYAFNNDVARDKMAGPPHEALQQPVFRPAQVNLLPAAGNVTSRWVEHDIRDP